MQTTYIILGIVILTIMATLGVTYGVYKLYKTQQENIDELIHLNRQREKSLSKTSDIVVDLPDNKLKNRKYLNRLGTNGVNLNNFDEDLRTDEWINQQLTYGFDERQVWALNQTMVELLYERVKYFVEYSPVDLEQTTIKIKNKEQSLEQWLEELTTLCEQYVQTPSKGSNELWTIWKHVAPHMYW